MSEEINVKNRKTVTGILLLLLFLGMLGTLISQRQTINDLVKQYQADRENIRSAYLYMLKNTDMGAVAKALEDLAAKDSISKINDTIEANQQQLDFFVETLLQLNSLRYGKEVGSYKRRLNYNSITYPVMNEKQEMLQKKIVAARYNLHAAKNELYYFDGILPCKYKELLYSYAQQVKAVDKKIKSWRTYLSYQGALNDREWEMISRLLDSLGPELDKIAALKKELALKKPIKLSQKQAEKIARDKYNLGEEYSLISAEEHNYIPGELSYRMNFSNDSNDDTEIMVAVSAVNGEVMAYYNDNISFAKNDSQSRLSKNRLKQEIINVVAEQTKDMGHRMVTFPDQSENTVGTAVVVGMIDGLPNLTRRIAFWITPEVGKVYKYQVVNYQEIEATMDLKPKLTADQVLEELSNQNDFLLYNQIGSTGLEGAKVERLLIAYSYFLHKPVLAYPVLLNNSEETLLLVNADSGKVERFINKSLLDSLENGVNVE